MPEGRVICISIKHQKIELPLGEKIELPPEFTHENKGLNLHVDLPGRQVFLYPKGSDQHIGWGFVSNFLTGSPIYYVQWYESVPWANHRDDNVIATNLALKKAGKPTQIWS